MLDELIVGVRFALTDGATGATFRDVLYMSQAEHAALTDRRLAEMKQARFNAWLAARIATPPDLINPWAPTPHADVDEMLRLARAGPSSTVWDMGSGDGRIVVAAAKLGATAVGVERSPALIAESRQRVEGAGVADRATIRDESLRTATPTGATVVTAYLTPNVLLEFVLPRFLNLSAGARLVTYDTDIAGWTPAATSGKVRVWVR